MYTLKIISNFKQIMITVSIVTYKTDLEELSRCLQSLESSLILKIFIVDNSNQEYIANFCSQYANVTYLGGENVGYGAGHNRALQQVLNLDVKYHLILNSDVYFNPMVLGHLMEYMENHNDVGQLIPNVTYPNGDIQYVCRLLPTPIDLIFRRFLPKALSKKINNRFLLQFDDHKHAMNVPFHMGCFMFFRVSALCRVGLFDESIFMYTEDIDITRRVHRHYRTMYWPNVTIVHNHCAASYKNTKMLMIHIRSAIKYFNKWGWIWDKERKEWNKGLLKSLRYK